MKLVEQPHYIPLSIYEEQIDRMVGLLSDDPNVVSIYQVGSVGTPGVSDADLWVIFKNGATSDFDHRVGLCPNGRYIFTHGLFGLSESHFLMSRRFRFFHDFKLHYGDDLKPATVDARDLDALVERQAALEYMINAYQVCTVERNFGVASVRNLLLYAKALKLDLAPLGVEKCSSGLGDVLSRIMDVRESWFEGPVDAHGFTKLHEEYCVALQHCLRGFFRENKFWYPHGGRVELRGNMSIENNSKFGEDVSGIKLPSWLIARHKRIRNLQRRFLRFEFFLPMDTNPPSPAVAARFTLIRQAQKYNRIHLPHFMPLPVGLSVVERDTERTSDTIK